MRLCSGLFLFMATKTYQEQLENVQAAIEKIEDSGQAYSISGRSMSRADLPTLYERERWLRKKAAREARGGGIRIRGGTPTG